MKLISTKSGVLLACAPCNEASIEYFVGIAEALDPRAKVKCLVCPPDSHPPDLWCRWELKLGS